MDITSKFLTPAVGFLVTVVFGFWLSKVGKPYNGILFNIHKLIALGTVIVASIQVYKKLYVPGPQSLLIISIIVAVIGVAALFTSGAMMSLGKLDYGFMLTIHRIAPILLAVVMGATVYILFS